MCLIGEPNSGKTSLFTPISRLIPARYIAMISKQKAFNKSLIDENTQTNAFRGRGSRQADGSRRLENINTRRANGTRPQVQNIKHGSHKMSNVHHLSDGHGLWCKAQHRYGSPLKKVLLQKFDLAACGRSTRILASQCYGLHRLGMQSRTDSRRRITPSRARHLSKNG